MTSDEHLIETRLNSEAVFDGRLLHVRRDTVRLPNGETSTREYIVHPGAVLIAPRLDDGRWIVERQFRYPGRPRVRRVPGRQEGPGRVGARDRRARAPRGDGYRAESWTKLGDLHPGVGYTNELIELWRADGLTHVGRKLDEDEHLDIVTMRGDDLLAAFDRGEITDAKTIATLFHLVRLGGLG
jgi:ADP-ribose pyrophosphatase